MKIWLTKNPEVPVREQLAVQIALAVASGDLKPDDRIPSTQEISRRFGIHANTVASAYRHLVDEGILEFRHGSGYFVKNGDFGPVDTMTLLNRKVEELIAWSRSQGLRENEILGLLRKRLERNVSSEVLLVESDTGLQEIVKYELECAGFSVNTVSLEQFSDSHVSEMSVVVAMFDEKPKLLPLLDNGSKCVFMTARSVSETLKGENRPSETEAIAVVSGWDGFLTMARILLLAARLEPGQLIIRSRNEKGWENAIRTASFVVCDHLTSTLLPKEHRKRIFSLVSESSLTEIREVLAASTSFST